MTDEHTFDDAARALETRETLRGSVELGGEQYPIEVREPTLDELEDIEHGIGSDADEVEAIREMVDRYLEAPDIAAGDIGISSLRALFDAMRDAWEAGEAFEAAEDQMPLDEGNANRRTSRR